MVYAGHVYCSGQVEIRLGREKEYRTTLIQHSAPEIMCLFSMYCADQFGFFYISHHLTAPVDERHNFILNSKEQT